MIDIFTVTKDKDFGVRININKEVDVSTVLEAFSLLSGILITEAQEQGVSDENARDLLHNLVDSSKDEIKRDTQQ